MDQYKLVFDKARLEDVMFFSLRTVTEYKDIQEFQEKGGDSYYSWSEAASKRYGTLTDSVYWEKACFLPEYAKIVSITVGKLRAENGEIKRTIKNIPGSEDEKTLLLNFMASLTLMDKKSDFLLCGHNILGYDIPFLIKRAMKHGIEVPATIKKGLISKPWENHMIDVVNLWKMTSGEFQPLNSIAAFLDLKYNQRITNVEYLSRQYHRDNDKKSCHLESANQTNLVMQLYLKLREM
jgi:DNA polymerase elongation subunit (family B)